MFQKLLNDQKGESGISLLIGILFIIPCLMAWFTHLYICFTEEQWGFLIAGAIFFPIAVVHGFGIWIGIW